MPQPGHEASLRRGDGEEREAAPFPVQRVRARHARGTFKTAVEGFESLRISEESSLL